MKQLIKIKDLKEFFRDKGISTDLNNYRYKAFHEQIETKKSLRSRIKSWIEALESEEYKQAKEMLYSKEKEGYCCLGVAINLTTIDLDLLPSMGNPSDIDEVTGMEVWEDPLAGDMIFRKKQSSWYSCDLENALISFNDDYEFSFSEIAMLLRYKFKIYE